MAAESTDLGGPVLGRDRRAALRPGLPARLPAHRQPARRRGPHAGGLRPGVPVAVVVHARHLRGLAAPDHHEPVPRPGPPQGQDPLRRARRRRRRPACRAAPSRPTTRCSTGSSTTTSRRRSPSCRPDFRAAVVLCDIEGLSYEEIADVLGLKLGTVRSRIHRGRTMLRKALAHRAPVAGRSRYSGPRSRADGGSRHRRRDGAMPAARRPPRLLGQRPGRRPARRPRRPSAPGSTSMHCLPCRAAGRARGLGQASASRRSPAPLAPTQPSDRLVGSLLELDPRRPPAWADTDEIERSGRAVAARASPWSAPARCRPRSSGSPRSSGAPMGIGGSTGRRRPPRSAARPPRRPAPWCAPAASVHGRLRGWTLEGGDSGIAHAHALDSHR